MSRLQSVLRAVPAVLALALASPPLAAQHQFPQPEGAHADAQTIRELDAFYSEIEAALKTKDLDKLMSFYAEDYLHHGINKRQLKFMWLELFGKFHELYSVHIFTRIDVHGDDAILTCTGGLFGTAAEGEDYQIVDRWVTTPHWLTRIGGRWQMIGGGTHEAAGKKGELHPFF